MCYVLNKSYLLMKCCYLIFYFSLMSALWHSCMLVPCFVAVCFDLLTDATIAYLQCIPSSSDKKISPISWLKLYLFHGKCTLDKSKYDVFSGVVESVMS